jgi:MYXO-CTERM domain-containing protein
MLAAALVANCVGQGEPENGVESVTKDIKNGTLMGTGGIGFAVKIDQTMSDGKKLICSGAFITPHVVLTAAHCTRNYDYGSTITPTTDTVIRYGAGFATSQKIAGGEKVGWRELGSTDIGLYRVAQAVSLPVIPKLYRSCTTVNLVGGSVVVYGRMNNGNQAPTAEYYMSPARTVRAIASGVGANGNYVQIDSTTDAGDSGGPWVSSQDRIVAVTHTSEYGSRFCDVAAEVETQVKEWGDTLAFVEDGGGADGGVVAQGGAAGSRDAGSGSGGAGGTNNTDAGNADARAGTGGAAGGASGRADAGDVTASGGTGAGGQMGTGAGTGGKAAGGTTAGASGSTASGSGGQAGTGAGGSLEHTGGAGSQSTASTGGAAGHRTDSGATSGQASSGCGCRIQGAGHSPTSKLALFTVLASVGALVRIRRRRRGW